MGYYELRDTMEYYGGCMLGVEGVLLFAACSCFG